MNIGIIIFVIIFIYLIFNVFSYLTEVHISPYEVEQGTIAVNNVYNGLILRNEKVITSPYSGSLNYYVKEGSKVSYGDFLYSVDENGDVAKMINEANQDGSSIDDENLLAEEKLAVILGTEGDGLATDTIADCDYTVLIPMAHGVDSLNVAAASAVAFWELGRCGKEQ